MIFVKIANAMIACAWFLLAVTKSVEFKYLVFVAFVGLSYAFYCLYTAYALFQSWMCVKKLNTLRKSFKGNILCIIFLIAYHTHTFIGKNIKTKHIKNTIDIQILASNLFDDLKTTDEETRIRCRAQRKLKIVKIEKYLNLAEILYLMRDMFPWDVLMVIGDFVDGLDWHSH